MSEVQIASILSMRGRINETRKARLSMNQRSSHQKIRDEIDNLMFKVAGGDYSFEVEMTKLMKLLKIRNNSKDQVVFLDRVSMYERDLLSLTISRFSLLRAKCIDPKKGTPMGYFLGMLQKMKEERTKNVFIAGTDQSMSAYNRMIKDEKVEY